METITMFVFLTDSDEVAIFDKLINLRASVPLDGQNHYGVVRHNQIEGTICFENFYYRDNQGQKVGVAGNKIIVHSSFAHVVSDWLPRLGIKVESVREKLFFSASSIRDFLKKEKLKKI